jgi:hypothetical protein
MSSTYGGMLEGIPTVSMNVETIERARQQGASMYGERPAFLIEPKRGLAPDRVRATAVGGMRNGNGEPRATLPIWTLFAWLHGHAVNDRSADGSELVLVWFVDQPGKQSIERLVRAAAMQVPWVNVARDYWG